MSNTKDEKRVSTNAEAKEVITFIGVATQVVEATRKVTERTEENKNFNGNPC